MPISPKPVYTATYGQEIPLGTIVLTPGENDLSIGKALLEEIKNTDGDILCEDIGYLIPARKKILLEVYQYSMLAKQGKQDTTFLVEKIKGKNLAPLYREGKVPNTETYFPKEIVDKVKIHYTLRN